MQIITAAVLFGSLSSTLIHAYNYDAFYNKVRPKRPFTKTLTVKNGGKWGEWVHTTFCPKGTYAKGYSLKIEDFLPYGDNSALNNIALFCVPRHQKDKYTITSSPAPGWGKWRKPVFCKGEDVFLTSFIMQMDLGERGRRDITAANYVNFRCRKFDKIGEHRIVNCGGAFEFGFYGQWSANCPKDSAICGMKTKYEKDQGYWDDSALNDVIFYCC